MSFSIKKIDIYGLFGCYNYLDINIENSYLLFYGENGVGKSTVLNIIFDFFSLELFEKDSNLRSLFEKLYVEFHNGSSYLIENNSVSILDSGKKKYQFEIEEGITKEHVDMLSIINTEVLFINDDSELHTVSSKKKKEMKSLEVLVKNVEELLFKEYERVLESNIEDMNGIFLEVVRRTVAKDISELELTKTHDEYNLNMETARKLSRYGLIKWDETYDSISGNEKSLTQFNLVQFYNYHQSNLFAKMDKIYYKIDSLIEEVNSYLFDKKITYHVTNGFKIIHSRTNTQLSVRCLSSGEKKLLRLLFSCIISSDNVGLYLVDEPELSLNMNWLPRIESSLKKLNSKNEEIQFVLCTHSFDIISQNVESVYKFEGVIDA
jgi:predicted ATPase